MYDTVTSSFEKCATVCIIFYLENVITNTSCNYQKIVVIIHMLNI